MWIKYHLFFKLQNYFSILFEEKMKKEISLRTLYIFHNDIIYIFFKGYFENLHKMLMNNSSMIILCPKISSIYTIINNSGFKWCLIKREKIKNSPLNRPLQLIGKKNYLYRRRLQGFWTIACDRLNWDQCLYFTDLICTCNCVRYGWPLSFFV